MLRWASIFLAMAVVTGVMGYTHIARDSAAFSRVLFLVSITLFVVFLAAGIVIERKTSPRL